MHTHVCVLFYHFFCIRTTDTGTEAPHPLHARPLTLGTPTPTSTGGTPLTTTTTTIPPDGGVFRGEAFGDEGKKRGIKPGGDNGVGAAEAAAVLLWRAGGEAGGFSFVFVMLLPLGFFSSSFFVSLSVLFLQ